MAEVQGLNAKLTADISDFDRKLQTAKKRLLGTESAIMGTGRSFLKIDTAARSASSGFKQWSQSVKQATTISDAARRSILNTSGSLGTASKRAKTLATQQNKATIQSANLAAQFNDISVMLQSGQSPFMLAMQQGTQINQVLDQMRMQGKSAGGALLAAFRSVISPANLLTIGLIAGGAALFQWARAAWGASDAAKAMDESFEDAVDKIAEMERQLQELKSARSPEEEALYQRRIAAQAEVLRLEEEIKENQSAFNQLQSAGDVWRQKALDKAKEEEAVSVKKLNRFRELVAELKRQHEATVGMADAERLLGEQMIDVIEERRKEEAEAAREREKANRKLQEQLAEARQEAMSLAEEFTRASVFANRFADDATVMAQSLEPVTREIEDGRIAMEDLTKELDQAAINALALANIDMTAGIDAATAAAAKLAGELGIALNHAIGIKNMAMPDTLVALEGNRLVGGFGGPSGPASQLPQSLDEKKNIDTKPIGFFPKKSGGGKKGGGGGGTSAAEQMAKDLEALRNKLATEAELELQSYELKKQQLAEFHEQKMISEQEYQKLMERNNKQHQDRMAEIDVYRYGTTLQKTGEFLGAMSDAFAQGNEKMVKVSKVLGAAQALIATYTGAAEALKLPFPQNLAAFATVMAQGMSAVAAIRGVSTSSKGSVAGGSGVATGGGTGQVRQPQRPNLSLTLIGDQGFSRAQIVQIAEALNDSADEGQQLVQLRGRQ